MAKNEELIQAFEAIEEIRHSQRIIKLIGDEWYDGGEWVCEIYGMGGLEGRGIDRKEYDETKKGWDEPSLAVAIRLAIKEIDKKNKRLLTLLKDK